MLFLTLVALWLAGFRGAHRSNAPINPVDISTGADPHDEAEFDLPDGEAMIQQFLAGLAKDVDNEYCQLLVSS